MILLRRDFSHSLVVHPVSVTMTIARHNDRHLGSAAALRTRSACFSHLLCACYLSVALYWLHLRRWTRSSSLGLHGRQVLVFALSLLASREDGIAVNSPYQIPNHSFSLLGGRIFWAGRKFVLVKLCVLWQSSLSSRDCQTWWHCYHFVPEHLVIQFSAELSVCLLLFQVARLFCPLIREKDQTVLLPRFLTHSQMWWQTSDSTPSHSSHPKHWSR